MRWQIFRPASGIVGRAMATLEQVPCVLRAVLRRDGIRVPGGGAATFGQRVQSLPLSATQGGGARGGPAAVHGARCGSGDGRGGRGHAR